MSKSIPVVAAFASGVLSALVIVSGIHTSTWAQTGLSLPDTIPIAKELFGPTLHNMVVTGNLVQQLDGLNCANCVFDNAVLTYGGGALNLTHPTFRKGIRIHLTGAAANTLVVVALVQELNRPNRPVPPSPFKPPILRQAHITEPATIGLITTVSSH
jgi:hypothetical protein